MRDLPERYPPYPTCHRRFRRWVEESVLSRILEALAEDLKDRGGLDLSECFIDGTFVVAKKRSSGWERPSGVKVRSSWRLQTALIFHSPCARRVLARTRSLLLAKLSRPASSMRSPSVDRRPGVRLRPARHDSFGRGHRNDRAALGNRKRPKTQDGRKLRRYKRRWKVERLFAWLHNFRRLVVRYERRSENYLGFVQLGCAVTLLRHF